MFHPIANTISHESISTIFSFQQSFHPPHGVGPVLDMTHTSCDCSLHSSPSETRNADTIWFYLSCFWDTLERERVENVNKLNQKKAQTIERGKCVESWRKEKGDSETFSKLSSWSWETDCGQVLAPWYAFRQWKQYSNWHPGHTNWSTRGIRHPKKILIHKFSKTLHFFFTTNIRYLWISLHLLWITYNGDRAGLGDYEMWLFQFTSLKRESP